MSETTFTAEDFADEITWYEAVNQDEPVILAALRIISSLEADVARLRADAAKRDKETDKICNEHFDVPPERDSEPMPFHAGWEACARSIAASIRRAREALKATER